VVRRRGLAAIVALLALGAGVACAAGGEGAETANRTTQSAGAAKLGLVPALRGFSQPVLLTWAPGEPGARYVVEQGGRIVRLAAGKRTVFLDVSALITAGGEQGLLGLAFHPRYASNRQLFVNYTSRDGRNVVARYRSNRVRALPGTRKIILSVPDPYGNHNGGHLAFGPDGFLYTTFGDGGSGGDPEDRSQDSGSLFGKLLRIDVDTAPPRTTVAALGLRNAWRFSFDRENDDLWLGDVGQSAIEEVSVASTPWQGQLNFGWDVYEGRSSFEEKPLGPGRLVQPIAQYSHGQGCSVTGGYVYRGKAVPAAVGRYFYGDYCSGTVWSLKRSGNRAVGLRREPFQVDSLTSFGEDAAGELYLVSHGGTIYRLAR
jgi:glucose/arabinose dehydrogenase